MTYRITIDRMTEDAELIVEKIYEQTVEEIDLRAVMAAVNQRPRKTRAKSEKKDEK